VVPSNTEDTLQGMSCLGHCSITAPTLVSRHGKKTPVINLKEIKQLPGKTQAAPPPFVSPLKKLTKKVYTNQRKKDRVFARSPRAGGARLGYHSKEW